MAQVDCDNTWHNLRIKLYFTKKIGTGEDIEQWKRAFEETVEFFQRFLSAKKRTKHIKIPQKCLDITLNGSTSASGGQSLRSGDEVKNADTIIFVDGRHSKCRANIIAMQTCSEGSSIFDNQHCNGIPWYSVINICQPTHASKLATLIHEVLHILLPFKKIENRCYFKNCSTFITERMTMRKSSGRNELSSPRALRAFKKHTGCDDISGVPVSKERNHWHPRYFGEEVYVPSTARNDNTIIISPVTIAALDDVGFVKVRANFATKLPKSLVFRPHVFGKNKGCNFLHRTCEEWSLDPRNEEFCSYWRERKCVSKRKFIAHCRLREENQPYCGQFAIQTVCKPPTLCFIFNKNGAYPAEVGKCLEVECSSVKSDYQLNLRDASANKNYTCNTTTSHIYGDFICPIETEIYSICQTPLDVQNRTALPISPNEMMSQSIVAAVLSGCFIGGIVIIIAITIVVLLCKSRETEITEVEDLVLPDMQSITFPEISEHVGSVSIASNIKERMVSLNEFETACIGRNNCDRQNEGHMDRTVPYLKR